MRVALDAHAALDADSGAGHSTLALIEELLHQASDDDEIVLFHAGDEPSGSLAWLLRNDKLSNASVPFRGRRSAWWRNLSFPAVERLSAFDASKGDLDVCHSLRPPLMPSQAQRRILTLGRLDPDSEARLPLSLRRSLAAADAVIVTSDRLGEELLRRSARHRSLARVESKLHTVRPGVRPRFFTTPRAATLVGLCDAYPFLGEPYLLALGGLAEPRRSLGVLLAACQQARATDPSLPPLVIVGRSADAPVVASLLDDPELGEHAYWIESLDTDLLPALYRGAELLLYPGLDFAFGLPVVEAAACGVPAVVGTACGAAELLDEAPHVVPELTTPAWAEALVQLHRDEAERSARARVGREQAHRARWDIAGRQHWELYRG